eukprot:286252-Alexandrium_andersonii.AAC.1
MSASLVGSEMCIRDSAHTVTGNPDALWGFFARQAGSKGSPPSAGCRVPHLHRRQPQPVDDDGVLGKLSAGL